jgi:hypothetical protein
MKSDNLIVFYELASGFFINLAAAYFFGIIASSSFEVLVNSLLYFMGCLMAAFISLQQSKQWYGDSGCSTENSLLQ